MCKPYSYSEIILSEVFIVLCRSVTVSSQVQMLINTECDSQNEILFVSLTYKFSKNISRSHCMRLINTEITGNITGQWQEIGLERLMVNTEYIAP